MSNREEEKGTMQILSVQVIERKATWPISALFLGNMVSSIGDILTFWQLLTLVFVGGLLRSPAETARGSMVPDLATFAHMRLE